jgi:hypothetical protein
MLKKFLTKVFAFIIVKRIEKTYKDYSQIQEKILNSLLKKAANTQFGQQHKFSQINNYEFFKKNVPIRDYEDLSSYISSVKKGKTNILWPGKPIYFAKTSGTTSGSKFIPITKDSIPNHINSSRNAFLFYINKTGNVNILDGKAIFIQGSPILEDLNGVSVGRLSGIAAHHVPSYLNKNKMPSFETNCIDDWEEKIDKICEETIGENMTVIGGIPSWVKMYFERLIKRSNKENLSHIFKNFSLYVYGGVNYKPYEKTFANLVGKKIDTIEFFPASEGFFAYQNDQNDKSLLLQYSSGIYYEFIKLKNFKKGISQRYNLSQVQLGISYILIISTNAGLWAYNTGDTVMFTSLSPPKILVTGRYKHFISAFGEHVIVSEVEQSLAETSIYFKELISEFTVVPKLDNKEKLPCHEWFIEFRSDIKKLDQFAEHLDNELCNRNSYYKDLIKGKILKRLEIVVVKKGGFNKHMKNIGKLGEQNKIPRLSNSRHFIKGLI